MSCPACSEERRGEASGQVGDEAVAKQHLDESDLSPNSVDQLVRCDYRWGSKTMWPLFPTYTRISHVVFVCNIERLRWVSRQSITLIRQNNQKMFLCTTTVPVVVLSTEKQCQSGYIRVITVLYSVSYFTESPRVSRDIIKRIHCRISSSSD